MPSRSCRTTIDRIVTIQKRNRADPARNGSSGVHGGGNMAAVEEMKSRWVYSELGSPRWSGAYAQLKGNTPLLAKARLHIGIGIEVAPFSWTVCRLGSYISASACSR